MFGKYKNLVEDLYSNYITESTETILPEVFEELNMYDDSLVGVHFSNGIDIKDDKGIPYLGLNKKPFHHDPIGIYVFPKSYVLSGKLSKNGGFYSMKYFYIIIPSKSANILNLSKITKSEYERILIQMGIPTRYWSDEGLYHRSTNDMSDGHKFWSIIERYKGSKGLSKNVSWNTLFRKTGYNVVYDEGDSIIHSNEPSQIIYLETNAYEVLYTNKNKHPIDTLFALFAKSFPDWRIRKKKYYDNIQLYLESPKKYYISVQPHNQGFSIQVGGFKESFHRNIMWEDFNSSIIEEIKEFINNNKYNTDIIRPLSYFNLIEKISKTYGLATKVNVRSRELEISKNYTDGDKTYMINFRLNEYGNELYCYLTKSNSEPKNKNKYRSNLNEYDIRSRVSIASVDEDIGKIMGDLFKKMEFDAKERYNRDDEYSYLNISKYEAILKTISFIKNRVFHIK